MHHEKQDEHLFFLCDWLAGQIGVRIQHASQGRALVKIRPQFAMGLGDRQVVRAASFLYIQPQRQTREQQAADNAEALKEGKPIVTGPFQKSEIPSLTRCAAL